MDAGTQLGVTGRPLTPSESEALAKCGDLLIFATENIKDVPEKIVSTISAAWDAEQAKKWDLKIATDFWLAFNSLCALIKPVTVDTLSANVVRSVNSPKWKFWEKSAKPRSLSRQTAHFYLWLLRLLLGVAVVLSFLASTTGHLNAEVSKLIDSGNKVAEKVVADTDSLATVIGAKKLSEADAKQQETVSRIKNQLQEQYYILDQMMQKTDVMVRLRSFGRSYYDYQLGNLNPPDDISGVREEERSYYNSRRSVGEAALKTSIYLDVINTSILPIILGMMGACAYVVRLISDQIKDNTFSSTSPIRHLVRVALGALAGVVIGFGGLASAGGLSSSALAFVAGYAVEPVFATIDSIAEKFRR